MAGKMWEGRFTKEVDERVMDVFSIGGKQGDS